MSTRRYRNSLAAGLILGLGLLFAALWPSAGSLYDLTGEEMPAGQLAGVVHWFNTAIRPQPRLQPSLIQASSDLSPFSVNTFLQQEVEPQKRLRSLVMTKEAGFQTIRQEFPWEDIEIHGKGDFVDRRNVAEGVSAWEKYDNIVDLAEETGLDIIVRLSNPPAWSRAAPVEESGTLAPPDDLHDFADFAGAVAERYQGRIHYFQIWNEPNGNDEWGYQDVDPEAYTHLLCLAYDRIKEVDEQAVVLAGALTPTLAFDGRNMNDLVYLQRMFNAGAGECYDVMTAQGYGLWSGATDRRLRPSVINFQHHLLIRDLMVANDEGHKPIWISELGWNVVPDELEARFGRVTEEQQARYTVEAYERIQADWPWIGVSSYWFLKRPSDVEQNQSWYYFRLLEPDFSVLPVYEALVEYHQQAINAGQTEEWLGLWQSARPWLFSAGAALSFFCTLMLLSPHSSSRHQGAAEEVV